jgi:hypothetical protein
LERTTLTHPISPRPFAGWALDAALILDAAHPGFLAHTFQGSDLIRQARFAALGALKGQQPDALVARLRAVASSDLTTAAPEPLAEIAHYLLVLKPRHTLESIYGSCPAGLVGLFARLGPDPISTSPGIYRLIWNLYADPQHRERAKLLMDTPGTITSARIRVVSALDGVLLRRSVLDRLSNPGEVASFREAIRLIQSLVPDASDERIGQSLDGLGECRGSPWARQKALSAWVLGWLQHMEHPPVPGPFESDDPDFRLLAGRTLLEAGRRYRNCLPDHLGHVAAGRKLFYEWTREPGAVVELSCLSDGQGRIAYEAGQIRGLKNARLRPEDLNLIRRRLSRAGVLFRGAANVLRTPLHGFLDIFEDEDANDATVSYLDALEDAWDEPSMEVA